MIALLSLSAAKLSEFPDYEIHNDYITVSTVIVWIQWNGGRNVVYATSGMFCIPTNTATANISTFLIQQNDLENAKEIFSSHFIYRIIVDILPYNKQIFVFLSIFSLTLRD